MNCGRTTCINGRESSPPFFLWPLIATATGCPVGSECEAALSGYAGDSGIRTVGRILERSLSCFIQATSGRLPVTFGRNLQLDHAFSPGLEGRGLAPVALGSSYPEFLPIGGMFELSKTDTLPVSDNSSETARTQVDFLQTPPQAFSVPHPPCTGGATSVLSFNHKP